MSLCLSAGTTVLALALHAFSLSWTHSVEKIEWREEWRVGSDGLRIEEAVVSGSGAGMEVPEGAVLKDGAWHYRPTLPAQRSVSFADAGRGAGDWRFCSGGLCRQMGDLVPSHGASLTLSVCNQPGIRLADAPPLSTWPKDDGMAGRSKP